MTSTGIAGDVVGGAARAEDAAAADGDGTARLRPRRLRRNAVALAIALVVAIGALIAMAVCPGAAAPRARRRGGRCGAAGLAMTWLLLPYFSWQFFHFQKQNLGLASLAAASSGAPSLTPAERRAVVATGCAGIAGLLAHPALLQVAVDSRLGAGFPAAGLAFGIAAAAGLAVFLRRPLAARPAGLTVTYVMALALFLPVFAFSSPYAAVGGLTIAHGAQYLLLMSLVAGGGEHTAGSPAAAGDARIARALALTVFSSSCYWAGPHSRWRLTCMTGTGRSVSCTECT